MAEFSKEGYDSKRAGLPTTTTILNVKKDKAIPVPGCECP
jgi:hypothetical protein